MEIEVERAESGSVVRPEPMECFPLMVHHNGNGITIETLNTISGFYRKFNNKIAGEIQDAETQGLPVTDAMLDRLFEEIQHERNSQWHNVCPKWIPESVFDSVDYYLERGEDVPFLSRSRSSFFFVSSDNFKLIRRKKIFVLDLNDVGPMRIDGEPRIQNPTGCLIEYNRVFKRYSVTFF